MQEIGNFKEQEMGNRFYYSLTDDAWAISKGLTHEIHLSHGEKRFAIVKKTVVYISVDENEFGNPVLEKWFIVDHTIYS